MQQPKKLFTGGIKNILWT